MDKIILFIIFIGIVAFLCYIFWLQIKIHNQKEELKQQSFKQEELYKKIINTITRQFNDIEWTSWDSSIHSTSNQYKRIERAVTDNIQLCLYNSKTGYAKMKGKDNYYLTNQYGCTCPDFRERKLPCKHMYKLALCLPDYERYLFNDDWTLKKDEENNNCSVLYGFSFFITGRNQKDIKQYIQSKGATVNSSLLEDYNTAVISTDDIDTSKTLTAKEMNIPIFSSNEIKDIFDDNESTVYNDICENPKTAELKKLLYEYKRSIAISDIQKDHLEKNNVQLTSGELQPIPIEYINGYKSPSGGFLNYASYQVSGLNKTTNRKTRRKYECFTESEAIRLAEDSGLAEPFKVETVQFPPPTEKQIQYANSLFITIPDNICKQDMSAIIDRVTEYDESPPDSISVKKACNKGIKFSRYIGKRALLSLLQDSKN